MSLSSPSALEQFISRWKATEASNRANCQLFVPESSELLRVEEPRPASGMVQETTYTFKRLVVYDGGRRRPNRKLWTVSSGP